MFISLLSNVDEYSQWTERTQHGHHVYSAYNHHPPAYQLTSSLTMQQLHILYRILAAQQMLRQRNMRAVGCRRRADLDIFPHTGLHGITIQLGISTQDVAKTPTYPVMCRLSVFVALFNRARFSWWGAWGPPSSLGVNTKWETVKA